MHWASLVLILSLCWACHALVISSGKTTARGVLRPPNAVLDYIVQKKGNRLVAGGKGQSINRVSVSEALGAVARAQASLKSIDRLTEKFKSPSRSRLVHDGVRKLHDICDNITIIAAELFYLREYANILEHAVMIRKKPQS